MNTLSVSLSSENTSQTTTFPFLLMEDRTTLSYILSGITERLLPNYLKIDWGDGVIETHENDILQEEDLTEDRYSSIFLNKFEHEYYPSSTTTTKTLTAITTIKYINDDLSTFISPLSIVNYNYSNSIEDLHLVNTVIIPNNKDERIYQFVTKKGGHLVEMKTSN